MNQFKMILGMIMLCAFCIITPHDPADHENQPYTRRSPITASPPVRSPYSGYITRIEETNPMVLQAMRATYARSIAQAQEYATANQENQHNNTNQ